MTDGYELLTSARSSVFILVRPIGGRVCSAEVFGRYLISLDYLITWRRASAHGV